MFKLINFIIATGFVIAGCSKSGGGTDTPKTKADYLASATWKFSSAGIDPDGNGTVDVAAPASLVQACLTDNTITFKSDKTGSIDEGPTKCDPASLQVTPFTWALSENDTKITLSTSIFAGIGNDAKIIDLTESKLTLSKSLTISGFPLPVNVVVILVH